MSEAASADTPKDFGKGPEAVVHRWLRELELASEAEKDWRESAGKIVQRYRGESKRDGDAQKNKPDSYNLLYSNVQTIGPILYNSTPEPVVERRFDDENPVASASSEVLRRAIKYAVGCQDFDEVISLAVQDYQLVGRSIVSVQYVPTMAPQQSARAGMVGGGAPAANPGEATPPASPGMQQTEAGDPSAEKTDEVVYEEVRFDLTPWRSFRRGAGRTWQDVSWIAFELDLPRSTCVKVFGEEIGSKIPLRSMQSGEDKRPKEEIEREQLFNRARVWQIWDKVERKVLWISPDYPNAPCKVANDEYNLSDFFNLPRPLYAVETSDSLVPVPEFRLYEVLANEAETIVNRMAMLTRAIRIRGGYDASLPEIEKILESTETAMIPVKNASDWQEKGGLAAAIYMWPLAELIAARESLSVELDRVKGQCFEILGVADIMRGSTDPNETMGAQAIKVRWGSLRTRRRQAEVQRFCRDLFRIAGELIAEKFSAESLAMMTGLQMFMTQAQKAQAQQTAAQMQPQPPQPGQPPVPPPPPPLPPEQMKRVADMLTKPTWEEIVGFLRNDALRHFRIDIQTDSTIALQDAEDQGDYAKMLSALADVMAKIEPLMSNGTLPFDAGKAMIVGVARKFRLGYEVEDKLSQMKAPPPQDPMNDPKVKVEMAKLQAKKEGDQSRAQADMTIEQHRTDVEAKLSAQKNSMEAQGKFMEALPALIKDVIIQELKNAGAIKVAQVNAGIDAGQSMIDHEEALAEQQQAAALQPQPQAVQ